MYADGIEIKDFMLRVFPDYFKEFTTANIKNLFNNNVTKFFKKKNEEIKIIYNRNIDYCGEKRRATTESIFYNIRDVILNVISVLEIKQNMEVICYAELILFFAKGVIE